MPVLEPRQQLYYASIKTGTTLTYASITNVTAANLAVLKPRQQLSYGRIKTEAAVNVSISTDTAVNLYQY
jgi:hypothetical protein